MKRNVAALFVALLLFSSISLVYLIRIVEFKDSNVHSFNGGTRRWFYEEEKWASEHEIAITREYQIKVNVSKFENRDSGIKEYLDLLSSLWNLPLSKDKSNIVLREVTVYDPVPCGPHKQQIRKRVHFDPFDFKKENYTTIDVKWSTSSNFSKIYLLPFSPRADFLPVSFEKLEYGM